MDEQNELEEMIRARLDEIKTVPARDPRLAARGRALFLNQAVSASEFQRRTGRKTIFRKEQFAMNMLVSLLVIAGLVFGGGATAVGAAQDDLPNEPLYALKIWSEDFSLQFQNDPQLKAERLMELAEIRVQEMTQLTEDGQTPPDQVTLRLEQHIHQALQICANMDEAACEQMLLQIRDRLQEQDRIMQQLQIHATQDAQPILERTREMLQLRLQAVENELLNRETIRNEFQYGQDEEQTPPAQNGNGQQNGEGEPQPGGNDNGSGAGPNTDPGEPNVNPGGPNPSVTPGSGGSGSGGNESGGNGSGGGGGGSGGKNP
jgi:predicted HTH domain antitoxin